MSLDTRAFRKINPSEFHSRFLSHDLRPDGRGLYKCRTPVISTGVIKNSIGSAAVRIGSTSVVAGIKAEVATPLDNEPQNGYIVINVDLGPLCSADFRPGKPSDEGQAMSQQIHRLVNRSGIVDRQQLCIEEGKLVWVLYVDVVGLDHDGSVIDASLMAVLAALKSAKLPTASMNEAGEWVELEGNSRPLVVSTMPVALTFCTVDDRLLVDPTYEEESIAQDTFTIIQDENSVQFAFIKPGGVPVSKQTLKQAISLGVMRATQVKDLLAAEHS
eukprot:TRINITY_DN14334_c0_g1_i1.p1 TRINITY_DN14334_c0_g1~~TRINITY_DN14334_c0_g1_i1.p1  ORF type:complete len:273 (-),score=58.65 TRINITY_DN14334_c0_g1_i1:233-1051(-)